MQLEGTRKDLQDFRRAPVQDPLDVLNVFRTFSKAIIAFLESKGREPSAHHLLLHAFVSGRAHHCFALRLSSRHAATVLQEQYEQRNLWYCVCAAMDSQIDVALHTLVQMAPEHLYYHVKVVEQLVWEPWAAESEAQFSLMLMVRSPKLLRNVQLRTSKEMSDDTLSQEPLARSS